MNENDKIRDLETQLNELKAQKEESAATIAESPMGPSFGFGKAPRILRKFGLKLLLILGGIVLLVALAYGSFLSLKGSNFTENKTSFIERVQALNELVTAQAFIKVVQEEKDNTLFGKDIGWNLPGTERLILVVIPGSIRAGIDFSQVSESDIKVDEKNKTATLTLPKPIFIGDPEVYFDKIEIFSSKGLFRGEANIKEGYEIADKAKDEIIKEATEQGVLRIAEENAVKTVKEMFQLVDYDVQIEFKE